jgi:hypothetical protein
VEFLAVPNRRIFVTGCLLAAAALVVGTPTTAVADAKIRLVVVVAKNSPLREISMRDLRRLYSGEYVSGPDGDKVIPIALPAGSPDRVAFDRAVLNMSPEQVARYWVDRKIRGQSGPPKSIDSPSVLQRVVAQIKASIGYVRVSDLRDDVRVLPVDGKGPNDADYPLEAQP